MLTPQTSTSKNPTIFSPCPPNLGITTYSYNYPSHQATTYHIQLIHTKFHHSFQQCPLLLGPQNNEEATRFWPTTQQDFSVLHLTNDSTSTCVTTNAKAYSNTDWQVIRQIKRVMVLSRILVAIDLYLDNQRNNQRWLDRRQRHSTGVSLMQLLK